MIDPNEKYRVLSEYFGHTEFRQGQAEIIDSLCNGRDVLCIMPTGSGKSMCYQIPALIFSGITLVVSPLIALMKDQVNSLVQSGVPAAFINSSLTIEQYRKVMSNLRSGKYKIIYVAPERLEIESFVNMCKTLDISMVAVDEAHCVSQWGQDFRPSYFNITDFVGRLPKRPVVGAFTATATNEVKEDIAKILKLKNPTFVTTGFDRPNLFFSTITPSDKNSTLLRLVEERKTMCGVIYCSTRRAVEEVHTLLCNRGYSAAMYHAGLNQYERKQNQDDFVFDRKLIMVSTNAFGMGIDKSNVSYVIHYNMPKDLESYYQEAGRAGRDGGQSDCILLYSPQDVQTNRFLIEVSEPNGQLTEKQQQTLKKRDYIRLRNMTLYSTTTTCLRSFMLGYFGDKALPYCGKCSNCIAGYETVDITIDAQKIMSCMVRTGQKYGTRMIIDILRGNKNQRLIDLGLNNQTTYGLMSNYSDSRIRQIINSLAVKGYLTVDEGEYPILKITPKAVPVLRNEEKITDKILRDKRAMPKSRKAQEEDYAIDTALLEHLKELRKTLAKRASVPAYVIFPDIALKDMCRKKPKTLTEFSNIVGVGRAKRDKYGEVFIKAIVDFEKQGKSANSK